MAGNGRLEYGWVARGDEVLVQSVGETPPELQACVESLLEHVDFSSTVKRTFGSTDDYTFYFLVDQGLCFIVAATPNMPVRICFAYLENVRKYWVENVDFHKDRDPRKWFLEHMCEELMYFSNTPDADKVRGLQAEVEEVKGVMLDNLKGILERGERLEDVQRKAEALASNAKELNKESKKLKV